MNPNPWFYKNQQGVFFNFGRYADKPVERVVIWDRKYVEWVYAMIPTNEQVAKMLEQVLRGP